MFQTSIGQGNTQNTQICKFTNYDIFPVLTAFADFGAVGLLTMANELWKNFVFPKFISRAWDGIIHQIEFWKHDVFFRIHFFAPEFTFVNSGAQQ